MHDIQNYVKVPPTEIIEFFEVIMLVWNIFHLNHNADADDNVNADAYDNLKLVVAPELFHPEVGRHYLVLQVLKREVLL